MRWAHQNVTSASASSPGLAWPWQALESGVVWNTNRKVTSALMVASTLAGNFELGAALVAGILGGLAMLVIIYMGRAMGMTRMDLLKTLGTMIPGVSGTKAYVAGLIIHLMSSAGFGLIHIGVLHAIGIGSIGAAAGWDVLLGAIHGVMFLVAMPMMLTLMHPLIRSGEMTAPGPALIGFGRMTPMGIVAAHVVFGLVTGAVYAAIVL